MRPEPGARPGGPSSPSKSPTCPVRPMSVRPPTGSPPACRQSTSWSTTPGSRRSAPCCLPTGSNWPSPQITSATSCSRNCSSSASKPGAAASSTSVHAGTGAEISGGRASTTSPGGGPGRAPCRPTRTRSWQTSSSLSNRCGAGAPAGSPPTRSTRGCSPRISGRRPRGSPDC